MKQDKLEQYAIAYIIIYPYLIDEVDETIFNNSLGKLFKLIQTKTPRTLDFIARAILENYINDKYGLYGILPSDLDTIYDLVHTLGKNDKDKSIKEFHAIIHNMQLNDFRNKVLDRIEEAKRYLYNNNTNFAIDILKSIPYVHDDHISNTMVGIAECLTESASFKTGISEIDNLGGFSKGNLMTIGGDSGTMKTMSSVWLCLRILKENPDFTCLYFEKEMPIKDIMTRLASNVLQIPYDEIVGMDDEELTALGTTYIEYLEKNPEVAELLSRFNVVPNTKFNNAGDMYRWIESYKPSIWCLDFISTLGGKGKASGDFNASLRDQVETLKDCVAHTDTFGILLGQATKGVLEKRSNKIMTKDDIEWSAVIIQYSAWIFTTFYPHNYDIQTPSNFLYFYFMGAKNRHSLKYNVPLIACPNVCDFQIPNAAQKKEMNEWLYTYKIQHLR